MSVIYDPILGQLRQKDALPDSLQQSLYVLAAAVGQVVPGYLRFTAMQPSTLRLNKTTTSASLAATLEYSTDLKTWETYDWTGTSGDLLELDTGDTVFFKGDNDAFSVTSADYYQFAMTGRIAAGGNIMSLLDSTLESVTIPCERCFANLFRDCAALVSAPELPATTLTNRCYQYIFRGTSVAVAPRLPATTLDVGCYYGMFFEDAALVSAPELPATTAKESCYYGMFYHCTALTTAPELPATTLATSCYQNMFTDTALTEAPELPATTTVKDCYREMFSGCATLVSAPELPATNAAQECYYCMFRNCSSLTTAPELPATSISGTKAYMAMFQYCSSLTTAPALPATTLTTSCYEQMFDGCTALTTAPELPATTLATSCYRAMFQNCSSLTTAPSLPAMTLATSCYQNMFYGCSLLNAIEVSFTAWTSGATTYWLYGTAADGTFTKPAELPETFGKDNIPSGWNVVVPAPPSGNLTVFYQCDGEDITAAYNYEGIEAGTPLNAKPVPDYTCLNTPHVVTESEFGGMFVFVYIYTGD